MATYNFRLTATGVAELKRDLESLGPAGASAFQRIEQGAQQAVGGSRSFGQTIQQAGFQIQDFTVQVQGGTSALVALAQQGSQFLGLFGAGGAIAGAALAIGAVALQMAGLGQRTEDATADTKKLTEELKRSLEVLTGMEAVSGNVLRNLRASVDARIRAASEDAGNAAQADIEKLFTTDEYGNRILRRDVTPDRLAEAQRVINRSSRATRLEPTLRAAESGLFDGGESARTRQGDQLATQIANEDARARLEAERKDAEARAKREEEERKAREREANAAAKFREQQNRADLDALLRRVDQEKREQEKLEAERERAAERALERAQRVADREVEVQIRAAERFADNMSRTLSDVFNDALSEGGMRSFWSVFEGLGRRALANVLGEIATQQVGLPLAQALLGSTSISGGGAGLGGAVNTAGSLASLGNLASGGGILGAANEFLFGTGVVGAMGPQMSTAGLLGSGGTLFGSAGLASAAIPVAGLAAAVLLPSLLRGRGRGNPYTQGSISLGADGQLVGYAAGDNGADPAGTQQQINQAISQLQQITSSRGLQFTRGADLFGDRTGRTLEQALDEIAGGVRAGPGASARVRSALDGGGITSLQGLTEALSKADEIDAFTDSVRRATLAITDKDALALEDQEKTAQARLDQARKLGLDITEVERLNALERAEVVKAANDNALRQSQEAFDLILQGAAENRRRAEEEARASAAAAASYRQAIASVGDRMIAEASRIREEVDAALLGPYSNLSPEARLALAGQRFRSGQLGLNDFLSEGARAYGTATADYAGFFDSALSGARARAAALDASAANVYASLRNAPGFATGGSFDVRGPVGNDNIFMPALGMRVTAGETVNVSRRDTMAQLVERIDRLIAVTAGSGDLQVGELRGIRRASSAASAMVRLERSR